MKRAAFEEPLPAAESAWLHQLGEVLLSLGSEYAHPRAAAYAVQCALGAAAVKAGMTLRELLEHILANLPEDEQPDPEWAAIERAAYRPDMRSN